VQISQVDFKGGGGGSKFRNSPLKLKPPPDLHPPCPDELCTATSTTGILPALLLQAKLGLLTPMGNGQSTKAEAAPTGDGEKANTDADSAAASLAQMGLEDAGKVHAPPEAVMLSDGVLHPRS